MSICLANQWLKKYGSSNGEENEKDFCYILKKDRRTVFWHIYKVKDGKNGNDSASKWISESEIAVKWW